MSRRTATNGADLKFPKVPYPQGFSRLATQQWDGNPEPIVRELLQNCLDAAVAAGRAAAVRFTIREVPRFDVPGIKAYEEHFGRAVVERENGTQGDAEKRTIRRIKAVLDQDTVQILCCEDNGIGLSPETMKGLLSEGNTDKTKGQAGSYGLGHLTAFAASDMRYVFYAGRTSSGNKGPREEISSGHTILASYRTDDVDARGGDGWWLSSEQPNLFSPDYPDEIPPFLEPERARLGDSGVIVCALGFNNFRSEREDPVEAIAQVAAKNFLVAIWRDGMRVTVVDEIRDREISVDRDSLERVLEPQAARKSAMGKGWLPGQQACWAYRALRDGKEYRLVDGLVSVAFRAIPKEERGRKSRVQLFRSGMWITNVPDRMNPGNFASVHPFDAVVMADEGRFAELVRGAEGPEHRGLDRTKRLDEDESQELLDYMKRLAHELSEIAGKVVSAKEFEPNIAVFGVGRAGAGTWRTAEKIPRRGSSTGQSGELSKTEKKKKSKSGKGGKGRRPPGGRSIDVRTSVRMRDTETLRVVWRAPKATVQGQLHFRVKVPSGADQTCENPMPAEWAKIKEIRVPDPKASKGYECIRVGGDGWEAPFPEKASFDVVLREPVADINVVAIDAVARKRSEPKKEGVGQ